MIQPSCVPSLDWRGSHFILWQPERKALNGTTWIRDTETAEPSDPARTIRQVHDHELGRRPARRFKDRQCLAIGPDPRPGQACSRRPNNDPRINAQRGLGRTNRANAGTRRAEVTGLLGEHPVATDGMNTAIAPVRDGWAGAAGDNASNGKKASERRRQPSPRLATR
jgi:hypothetical protein